MRSAAVAALLPTGRGADIWFAGLRLPNVLQNLLGEGTLSASFIPIYARMLEEGREEEAGRFAGAILGILIVVAYAGAIVGIVAAPWLAVLVAQGPGWILSRFGAEAAIWSPEEIGLLARVLRILFPMTATLVVSAWALGVLNSHRRFFLSYVAPVVWNLAIIGAAGWALGSFGAVEGAGAIESAAGPLTGLAIGALIGGALQLLVQIPTVLSLLSGLRISGGRGVEGVREAIRNFGPVVLARGVVNLSALLDVALAAALAGGAISLLSRAQMLYLLPISLFGMAIAASELPELSRAGPGGAGEQVVARRVRRALRSVLRWLVPSTVAYLLFGDLLIAALLERGGWGPEDSRAAGWVLAAYALGLAASGSSRTLTSAFYALRDTRTPARIAILRVCVSLGVGAGLMFPFDRWAVGAGGALLSGGEAGVEAIRLGAVGLALGAAAGAWFEFVLLKRALGRRIGPHGPGSSTVLRFALAAGIAGGAVALLRSPLTSASARLSGRPELAVWGGDHLLLGGVLLLTFGGIWFGALRVLGGGRDPSGWTREETDG